MQLSDLLDKPLNELTDDELNYKINILKRLKMQRLKSSSTGERKKAVPKTNKEKQVVDLLKSLSADELKILYGKLSKEKEG